MKKIITSLMAVVLTVGLVAGSAYALFSNNVDVGGLTITTGNADLKIWNNGSWQDGFNPSDFVFKDLYPGVTKKVAFSLKNSSLSAISLKLAGKISSVGSQSPADSWEKLKDHVFVQITDQANGNNLTGGWRTIKDWNAGVVAIGDSLSQNQSKWYNFELKVDSGAGNEISGRSLTYMTFQFTGTQQ